MIYPWKIQQREKRTIFYSLLKTMRTSNVQNNLYQWFNDNLTFGGGFNLVCSGAFEGPSLV